MPCEGGVLPFDVSEIHKYQKKVDGWDITKGKDEIFFLSKKFEFENFLKISKMETVKYYIINQIQISLNLKRNKLIKMI